MKLILSICIFLLSMQVSLAQTDIPKAKKSNKGTAYIYWGWNRGYYSDSDIRFRGDGYDFTLDNVVAKDRQTEFSFDNYLNPANMTSPQTNLRVGYYFKEDWEISIGLDHMKYVVQQGQTVKISGDINGLSNTYDGTYNNDDIVIQPGFLKYEHTDGLNNINVELRRNHKLYTRGKVEFNIMGGVGIGILFPRTDITLFDNEKHNNFHLPGYGTNLVVGINTIFYDHFFIQTEAKGGYINMTDIRTTYSTQDNASQSFFFSQFNIVFGYRYNFNKSK